MGNLSNYFDYAAFARDLFMYDYYMDNGHVFRHYWGSIASSPSEGRRKPALFQSAI